MYQSEEEEEEQKVGDAGGRLAAAPPGQAEAEVRMRSPASSAL